MAIVPFGMLVNAFLSISVEMGAASTSFGGLGRRLGMMVCVALTGWGAGVGCWFGFGALIVVETMGLASNDLGNW